MDAQPKREGGLPPGQFHTVVEFIPASYREVWLRMRTSNTLEVGDSDLIGARPKKDAHHE